MAKALIAAGEARDLKLHVLAVVRSKEKAKQQLSAFLEYGLELIVGDVLSPLPVEEPVDYIFHGASVTASKDFVEHPVETILTTLKGTEHLLELAREKQVKGMVYLSSMEAYGVVDPEHYNVKETDYGYIDPLQVRSAIRKENGWRRGSAELTRMSITYR